MYVSISGPSLERVNGCNCTHRFWEISNCTHRFWQLKSLIVSIDFDNFHVKMGVTKKTCTHRFKFLKRALCKASQLLQSISHRCIKKQKETKIYIERERKGEGREKTQEVEKCEVLFFLGNLFFVPSDSYFPPAPRLCLHACYYYYLHVEA